MRKTPATPWNGHLNKRRPTHYSSTLTRRRMRQSHCSRVLASWPQTPRRTCTRSGTPRVVQPARVASGAGAVAEMTEGKVEMTLTNASVNGSMNGSVSLHGVPVNDWVPAGSQGRKICNLTGGKQVNWWCCSPSRRQQRTYATRGVVISSLVSGSSISAALACPPDSVARTHHISM